MAEKNIHEKHRERMRAKLLSSEGDILEEHEALEMLLYACQKQRNTNPIAQNLLQRFGSLSGVFEADYHALMEVEGIGTQAATLIKLQAVLCRMYAIDKQQQFSKRFRFTPKNAGGYVVNYFYGYKTETFIMFCLRADCSLICAKILGKGSVSSVLVDSRKILQTAMESNAVYVVLAHNHPNGTMVPSQAEVDMTREIAHALTFSEIRLIDHIIVCGNRYISLANDYKILAEEE